MTPALALLLALLGVYLVVCAGEWVGMEVASLALVVSLAITGILGPDEAVSGFSNPVVIAIAGLYVINGAVDRSGFIAWLGERLAATARRTPRGALALLLATGGAASMFVSNVATVALLAPAVLSAARQASISPSRFLMPLAFASLIGGTATLIGATGNLIVQGMAIEAGAPAFSFFEFALVGLPLLTVVLVYLVVIGWRTVPERRPADEGLAEPIRDFLVEVVVPQNSALVGMTLTDAALRDRREITVLALHRDDRRTVAPEPTEVIAAGDRLVLEAGSEALAEAVADGELETRHRTIGSADIESADINLYEILVLPRSSLVGKTALQLSLRRRHGITLLAVLRGSSPVRRRPERVVIQPGDELLVQGPRSAMEVLEEEEEVILLNRAEGHQLSRGRLALALGTLVGVVALTATGVMSLAIAVLLGVTMLVAVGSLTVDEAIKAVNFKVVVIVACVLPLGHAFEAAGAVGPVQGAFAIVDAAGGAWATLAALFVVVSTLVQVVQKAAIAIGVPLAFAAAQASGADTAPFLMAVAMAGSCAFLTPLAHPVNLIVHAPGHYRFTDFARVGLPLQVIVTVVAVALIPIFWPFAGP